MKVFDQDSLLNNTDTELGSEICLQLKPSQGKFILTVTLTHLSDSKDEGGNCRNTGKRRTLIILQSDKAIETHEIIAKLIDLMKFF